MAPRIQLCRQHWRVLGKSADDEFEAKLDDLCIEAGDLCRRQWYDGYAVGLILRTDNHAGPCWFQAGQWARRLATRPLNSCW